MKTTLNLDDELLRRAKRRAAARGTTLTALVEEGLRAALVEPPRWQPAELKFPTSAVKDAQPWTRPTGQRCTT
ncbi:MAG: type II toxin-antitoxin system VapB family antitoxin [Actinomycetota bacterium]|nr:type II toxin-antitoxin system VapB family antitoxin [Actinomycetota bacterium]